MSREMLFDAYRDQVIKEESVFLKEVEKIVVNSGLINFDDVFKNPEVVSDIFKNEGIISDLKIRDEEIGTLDKKADKLIIFNRVRFDSSEISGNMRQIIVTSKDEENAKKNISETLSDCDVSTGYKEFFSEENKLQLIFSQGGGMLFSGMISCGEDQ